MTYEWIDTLVSTIGFRRSPRIPEKYPQPHDFVRLELSVGGPLPEEYRYFLAKWGGGYFSHPTYFTEAPIVESCPGGDSVIPELWYPLVECDDSIENMIATYRGRIPTGVLPCARDAFGNEICLDVAGAFPGTVWFWDHEQQWLAENYSDSLENAAREVDRSGVDASRFSVHDIIRAWARLHSSRWDRPADYMGMYRIADSFADLLRSLRRTRYDSISYE